MLGWACATPIHAGEYGLGVGLYVAHDSNINRVEVDQRSEWTQALLGSLFFRENTVDVTARVRAQVERRHYYTKALPDDTLGFADGAGVWNISPRRLTWTVEDTFRMVQTNLTAPASPTNLTKSNTLSTGPDFTLTMSSTNSAVIGGRYGRFDIQDSNADNQRFTAYVRGVHAVSAQTKASLNYEAAEVRFNPGAQVYSKFARDDLFGRFEYLSAVNNTVLDLGATWVTQYGSPLLQCQARPFPPPYCSTSPSSLEPGRFARLTFSQTLSPQSTLSLLFSRQLSDTYTDMIAGVTSSTAPRDVAVGSPTGTPFASAGTPFASADLYHSWRGDLTYGYNDPGFRAALQGYERRVDFVNLVVQDYQEKGATFFWTWLYSDAVRFNASRIYSNRSYDVGRRDTDSAWDASGVFRLNSNVTMILDLARYWRQSTVPLNSYVDNRVALNLGYIWGLEDVRIRQ
jgi:hypothetical protein